MRIIPAIALLATLAAAPSVAFIWEPVGMDGVTATCIEADTEHERILVGTVEGFWIHDLAAGIWTEFDEEGSFGRQVHAIQWAYHDPLRIISGRENAFFKGYLELSLDGGVTGDLVHLSQGGAFVDIEQVDSFYFACGISDITPGELLRSADGGATWTPVSGHGHTALTAVVQGIGEEMAIAGDDEVWWSADHGATWHDAGAGLGDGLVHCLAAYFPSGDAIAPPFLAGNDAGLWHTWAPGFTWEQILAGESVRNVAVMYAPAPWPQQRVNEFAVVTADGRVLVSHNPWSGTWTDETGNLPAPAVDLAFDPAGRDLYVCTEGGGTHRFHPVISSADDVPAITAATLTAWPNPFNPRTNLRWNLPREASGRLAVYDLAGRVVAVLEEGSFPAGERTRTWDAAGQASGVYVARLETDRGSAAARLVLVR